MLLIEVHRGEQDERGWCEGSFDTGKSDEGAKHRAEVSSVSELLPGREQAEDNQGGVVRWAERRAAAMADKVHYTV